MEDEEQIRTKKAWFIKILFETGTALVVVVITTLFFFSFGVFGLDVNLAKFSGSLPMMELNVSILFVYFVFVLKCLLCTSYD